MTTPTFDCQGRPAYATRVITKIRRKSGNFVVLKLEQRAFCIELISSMITVCVMKIITTNVSCTRKQQLKRLRQHATSANERPSK
ncbi:hypothetical protein DICVIV_10562 [Dictyocaulus viviparus]|uniref:Uncharacterized protein n=1 Tax=Dictyocaulus viviparus TaxID=29172 RepID=A0A0D8XM14_DICVI|nr:hypothetical protein DICVIV_10562 [Dictyocaulus viviparus]